MLKNHYNTTTDIQFEILINIKLYISKMKLVTLTEQPLLLLMYNLIS